MTKRKSERFLRCAFVITALTTLGTSTLYTYVKRPPEKVGGLLELSMIINPIQDPEQLDDSGMGLLTYIKHNYKRWLAAIKKDPVELIHFKEKLKKFLSVPKTGKDKQLDHSK